MRLWMKLQPQEVNRLSTSVASRMQNVWFSTPAPTSTNFTGNSDWQRQYPINTQKFLPSLCPFPHCTIACTLFICSANKQTTSTYLLLYCLLRGIEKVSDFPSSSSDKEPAKEPGSGSSCGGGNGNPFQSSYLGNSKDRGACGATVPDVTMSWTWLSTQAFSSWFKYLVPGINPGSSAGKESAYNTGDLTGFDSWVGKIP